MSSHDCSRRYHDYARSVHLPAGPALSPQAGRPVERPVRSARHHFAHDGLPDPQGVRYFTGCSLAGRYYAHRRIPKFDRWGLPGRRVLFSRDAAGDLGLPYRAGSGRADARGTRAEQRLGLRVYHTLRSLAGALTRERFEDVYLYLSAMRRKRQHRSRRGGSFRFLPPRPGCDARTGRGSLRLLRGKKKVGAATLAQIASLRQAIRQLQEQCRQRSQSASGVLISAADAAKHAERCPGCGIATRVLKTWQRTGVTLKHGSFRLRQTDVFVFPVARE